MNFTSTTGFARRLLSLLFITVIVWAMQSKLPLSQSVWMVWSIFLFALLTVEGSLVFRAGLVILSGTVATIGVSIVRLLQVEPMVLLGFITLATFACLYYGQRYTDYLFPAFIINLMLLLANLPLVSHSISQVSQSILLGAFVVAAIDCIFHVWSVKRQQRILIANALNALKHLVDDIFACYLQPDYADNVYLYERRLHLQKQRYLQSQVLLTNELKDNHHSEQEAKHYMQLLKQFDLVYDVLLDAAQLRRRLSDFTVLAVCQDELRALARGFHACILQLTRKVKNPEAVIVMQDVTASIERLEAIYQQVLQVSAPEPLVIQLFIASLTALYEELNALMMLLAKDAA